MMYKQPENNRPTIDMNYLVPGLAFYSSREFGLVTVVSRIIESLITWMGRLVYRSTRT